MLFLYVAPPLAPSLPIKAPTCLSEIGVGGDGWVVCLWTDVCPELKQTFLSTILACLLAFERRAARAHTLQNHLSSWLRVHVEIELGLGVSQELLGFLEGEHSQVGMYIPPGELSIGREAGK